MVSSLNGCDISSFFSYPSHQISLSLKSVNQTNFPYPHPQNVFLCNLLAHIQDNNKRKHGYFRVAYTYFSCFRIKMYAIDPGYFQVAYTTSSSSWRELGVIDPGYFQVAYTQNSKTSLCNKVLYCEVYNPYSFTRVRVIFCLQVEDLNSGEVGSDAVGSDVLYFCFESLDFLTSLRVYEPCNR